MTDLPGGARTVTRPDGLVLIRLDDDRSVLQEALDDAVSSLPPRGEPGNGPSTWWIDRTLAGLQTARDGAPFIWGNTTLLRVVDDQVEARWDHARDDEAGDRIGVAAFTELLLGWKAVVLEVARTSTAPLPEVGRRNRIS